MLKESDVNTLPNLCKKDTNNNKKVRKLNYEFILVFQTSNVKRFKARIALKL